MERFANKIQVGDQVYLREGGDEVGSVRLLERDHLVVYVENGGDFVVKPHAIAKAHDGKVVLDPSKIDGALKEATAHAHDREEPGL